MNHVDPLWRYAERLHHRPLGVVRVGDEPVGSAQPPHRQVVHQPVDSVPVDRERRVIAQQVRQDVVDGNHHRSRQPLGEQQRRQRLAGQVRDVPVGKIGPQRVRATERLQVVARPPRHSCHGGGHCRAEGGIPDVNTDSAQTALQLSPVPPNPGRWRAWLRDKLHPEGTRCSRQRALIAPGHERPITDRLEA